MIGWEVIFIKFKINRELIFRIYKKVLKISKKLIEKNVKKILISNLKKEN